MSAINARQSGPTRPTMMEKFHHYLSQDQLSERRYGYVKEILTSEKVSLGEKRSLIDSMVKRLDDLWLTFKVDGLPANSRHEMWNLDQSLHRIAKENLVPEIKILPKIKVHPLLTENRPLFGIRPSEDTFVNRGKSTSKPKDHEEPALGDVIVPSYLTLALALYGKAVLTSDMTALAAAMGLPLVALGVRAMSDLHSDLCHDAGRALAK